MLRGLRPPPGFRRRPGAVAIMAVPVVRGRAREPPSGWAMRRVLRYPVPVTVPPLPGLDEPSGPGRWQWVPASQRTHHDVTLRKAAVLMIKTRGGAA